MQKIRPDMDIGKNIQSLRACLKIKYCTKHIF